MPSQKVSANRRNRIYYSTGYAATQILLQFYYKHKERFSTNLASVHTGHIPMPTRVPKQNMVDMCRHRAVSRTAQARSIV